MIRKALFWTHLAGGVTAGAIIIMMSATGVVLTYEAQWIHWAESRLDVETRPGTTALGLEEIRDRASAAGQEAHGTFAPATVTFRPGPGSAVQVSAAGGQRVYLNPYDGTLLATGFPRLEAFLEAAKGWHRWFNVGPDDRRRGRAWTGAANLVFLLMLCSGPILWVPRTRTWAQFRQVLFFRRGLRPRTRDFNWHNVLGVWSATPLLVIVASATVVSYAWAGDLVGWAAGDDAGRPASVAEPLVRAGLPDRAASEPPDVRQALLTAAGAGGGPQVGFRKAVLTLPRQGAATVSAQVYRGHPGQPQHLEALRLDLRTGQVVERDVYDDQPRARRFRSFLRYAHTGEYWGLAGQTIAGIASLATVVLGITGISMALRRFASFRRRHRQRS